MVAKDTFGETVTVGVGRNVGVVDGFPRRGVVSSVCPPTPTIDNTGKAPTDKTVPRSRQGGGERTLA